MQEFISQARPTRDLRSGSYLLSWLVAHGIKAVTDQVGPDCVLFPALRGQPLFDLLHKQELYDPLGCWKDLRHSDDSILMPNLPNRFLAVVPEKAFEIGGSVIPAAAELARIAEKAMRDQLEREISEACLAWLKDNGHPIEPKALPRWNQQLRQFLTVHWQVWPWAGDVRTAIDNFKRLPNGQMPTKDQQDAPAESLERALTAATQGIPFADIDPRNHKHRSWKEGEVWKSVCLDANGNDLKPEDTPIIEDPGFAWAAHYAAVEFWLAARRNTRDFERWALIPGADPHTQEEADASREGSTKDVLSGKEETIGSPDWQKNLVDIEGHLFREGDRLGAINLVKRIWHIAYLEKKRGLKRRRVSFDSVPAIAAASWRRKLVEATEHAGKERDLLVEVNGFGPLASAARDFFPATIEDWNTCSDRAWLEMSDASIFHLTEWDRAIRDEQNRDGGHRADVLDKLRAARAALAKLHARPEDGGLGKPLSYVAILAMDGDSMGEWLCGAKSPKWREQLAQEAREYFERQNLKQHYPRP